MADWLNDIPEREPDITYTQADALADGLYRYVAEGVAVTSSVAALHPDQRERERFALRLAELYRRGVYADPPDADEHGEADAWQAIYRVDDVIYFVMATERQDTAAVLLVIMLPEDY